MRLFEIPNELIQHGSTFVVRAPLAFFSIDPRRLNRIGTVHTKPDALIATVRSLRPGRRAMMTPSISGAVSICTDVMMATCIEATPCVVVVARAYQTRGVGFSSMSQVCRETGSFRLGAHA